MPAQRKPRRSAADTREHVLEVARELFYWRGIRATGIDAVAGGSGVATATLYRVFGSKDALVEAYVRREAAGHLEWLEASLGDPRRPAGQRLGDLFTALEHITRSDVCRGCPFQMALAEIPERDHPAHREAVELKRRVRERFGELAAEHAGAEAERLADELMLLFEGAFATAVALGPPARAAEIVRALLAP